MRDTDDLEEQWKNVWLASRGHVGRRKLAVEAALSIMMCSTPMQVRCDSDNVLDLARHAFDELPSQAVKALKFNEDGSCAYKFPLKATAGAMNKVNCYSNEILPVMKKEHKHLHNAFVRISGSLKDLYDDQVSALLLYTLSLYKYIGLEALDLSVKAIRQTKNGKNLTTVIKSLGWNGSTLGSMFIETQCLLGRDVGDIDMDFECARRTDPGLCRRTVVDIDDEQLRTAVRGVIKRELSGRTVEFEDVNSFWSRRWGWYVNGAHSRTLERFEPKWGVEGVQGRIHRRVFSENTEINPLTEWSGVAYFSTSVKLETGKKRALFAGDSVTYTNFEHILKPVERAWRNVRCVLDPGTAGHVGVARRVRKMQERGMLNMMLDYDDFNSQHSTRAMQIVFEELVGITGYDAVQGAKLVKSFERSRVISNGVDKGWSRGTLMSGHRATTFINSVLNEAYLTAVSPRFGGLKSVHVGDDVYVSVRDMAEAAAILRDIDASDLRVNPVKQSVGFYCAEFLRMAMTRDAAYGYVARCIGSIVDGNWENDVALEPLQALRGMCQSSWTLMNRAQNRTMYKYLVPSCVRMTGLSVSTISAVLSGLCAVGSGPQLGYGRKRRVVEIKEVVSNPERWDDGSLDNAKRLATTAYLAEHAMPLEIEVLKMVDVDVTTQMLESSYGKTLAGRKLTGSHEQRTLSTAVLEYSARGSVTVSDALGSQPESGVLTKYPLIMLVRNALTLDMLPLLVERAGGDGCAYDILVEAFGSKARGCMIDGWLSYADSSWLSGRCDSDVITVDYPMYM